MGLTRDQILSAGAPAPAHVPEFGGEVLLRPLSASAAMTATAEIDGDAGTARLAARLIIAAAVDDDGAPLFSDDDLDIVAELPAAAVKKLASVIMQRNGLLSTSVDSIAGESEPSPGDTSATN